MREQIHREVPLVDLTRHAVTHNGKALFDPVNAARIAHSSVRISVKEYLESRHFFFREPPMTRFSPLIIASSVLLLSACATKEFVKETVAPVQTSVDGLSTRVQANDDGLKALDGRLQSSEARMLGLLQQEAAARTQAINNLPKPPGLLMSTVLTDDKIKFTSGRAQLTEQAGQELNQLVAKLKADNQPVFIEIQGHTDSTGSDAGNEQLGLKRAEAVRTHLARAGLPLARMATISYGESAPLADNNTREGRSTNRRVQLIVMR